MSRSKIHLIYDEQLSALQHLFHNTDQGKITVCPIGFLRHIEGVGFSVSLRILCLVDGVHVGICVHKRFAGQRIKLSCALVYLQSPDAEIGYLKHRGNGLSVIVIPKLGGIDAISLRGAKSADDGAGSKPCKRGLNLIIIPVRGGGKIELIRRIALFQAALYIGIRGKTVFVLILALEYNGLSAVWVVIQVFLNDLRFGC